MEFSVELKTTQATIFSGPADSVELRTTDGFIAVTRLCESYFNFTDATQITVRRGSKLTSFVLENAAASLRGEHLCVVAEEIRTAILSE